MSRSAKVEPTQNSPLRVLQIDTEMGWRGGQQQVCGLVEGMLARGHEPMIVCRPGSELDKRFTPRGLTCPVKMRSEFDLAAVRNIVKCARQTQAQILHAQTGHAHTLALLAGRWANLPVVVSRRVNFPLRHGWLQDKKYLSPRITYVAVCDAIRHDLMDWGIPAERIFRVHSGPDLNRFSNPVVDNEVLEAIGGLPQGTHLIVSPCALQEKKDIPTLMRALAVVRKQAPELSFKLVIAGKGPMLDALIQLRKELNLDENHVHFAGFVRNIPGVLSMANIGILSTHSEGIGSTVLEIMASGVPVIATATDGIPEIINHGKNGLLVPRSGVDALANAILFFLKNPDAAQNMARRAKHVFDKDFTLDFMTEGNIRVYCKTLGIPHA